MIIKDIFQKDIERNINGVIKVADTQDIQQELDEYVITRDLRKHFVRFFEHFSKVSKEHTQDIGVWISGFFGSGKSHFLKMLSYLMSNKENAVERFREKFNDPATFRIIEDGVKNTETILFNIDTEGSDKNDGVIRTVFLRMLYRHCGFYDGELRIANLEWEIEKSGKTEEFRRTFEEFSGSSWVDVRGASLLMAEPLTKTLQKLYKLTPEMAEARINTLPDINITFLTKTINEYLARKPEGFRLVFMVDEVGQYIGDNTSLLLNLQSFVEDLGMKCKGQVWVVCTGQDALDDVLKVQRDAFSKIQGRFLLKLSLTSTSVSEVIQKRLLDKKPEYVPKLEKLYEENAAVLENLFCFKSNKQDLRGFQSADEFSKNFPLVPYQYLLLQDAFNEIRRHGNAGKHLARGERSMLSSFHSALKTNKNGNEYTLVPFYCFYDGIADSLDEDIRRVINRCANAVEDHAGLEPMDVNVLKLLYLIRYVDDMPATMDNLVILMADNIHVDKVSQKKDIQASLKRLEDQHYIGRVNDTYQFLTDEEQDMYRVIYTETTVEPAMVSKLIGEQIFTEIYKDKKLQYNQNVFSFNRMVDGMVIGNNDGSLCVEVLTPVTAASEKNVLQLNTRSKDRVLIVLSDEYAQYYDLLEKAEKVRRYVSQHNLSNMMESTQKIIQAQNTNANEYKKEALRILTAAITSAQFYVAGERRTIKGSDAQACINQALQYLVTSIYDKMDYITKTYEDSENTIKSILNSVVTENNLENTEAIAEIEQFLETRLMQGMPVSMDDLLKRFKDKPYGWREIDIVACVALLLGMQKIILKSGGEVLTKETPRLVDKLRKKTEVGKTLIAKRERIPVAQLRQAKSFLTQWLDNTDIPTDEDGMVEFICTTLEQRKEEIASLLERYRTQPRYPGKTQVQALFQLLNDIYSQRKDGTALIQRLLEKKNDILDAQDQVAEIQEFFANNREPFEKALAMEARLEPDRAYLEDNEDAVNVFARFLNCLRAEDIFHRIPQLTNLMGELELKHNKLLVAKRDEVKALIGEYRAQLDDGGKSTAVTQKLFQNAVDYYTQQEAELPEVSSLIQLDGKKQQFEDYWRKYKQNRFNARQVAEGKVVKPVPVFKKVSRQFVFPDKRLESVQDIDAYLEQLRKTLVDLVKKHGGIELN